MVFAGGWEEWKYGDLVLNEGRVSTFTDEESSEFWRWMVGTVPRQHACTYCHRTVLLKMAARVSFMHILPQLSKPNKND